jgi:hypothetical protein
VAWQNGKYIQVAIASNMSKNNKYPKEPYLASVDVEKKVSKKEPERLTQEEIKRKFMERMIQLNSRFKEEV